MGYEHWVVFNINNKSDRLLRIQGATKDWGKYYYPPDKDTEVTADQLNTHNVLPGGIFTFGACGRKSSPSGTFQTFRLWDPTGGLTACSITFSVPYDAKSQKFVHIDCAVPSQWVVSQTGANTKPQNNEMGDVYVTATCPKSQS